MSTPRSRLALLGLAYLGFISLGLPDGLLGVAWPKMKAGFALEPGALGALLVAATAGYVTASAASGWVLARVGVGALLALSCVVTGLALFGYAAAPAFAVVVGFGVFAGLGAGAIDAGVNSWIALHHSNRSASFLHACYGVGAAAGPALMGLVLAAGRPWTHGYSAVAAAQLALASAFFATRGRWQAVPVAARSHAADPGAAPALGATTLAVAVFFVYTGLEAAAGAWSYSLLAESRGHTMAVAAAAVSAFWAGLTLGRVAAGLVAPRCSAHALLSASLGGVGGAAALVWLDPLPGAALVGLGLLGLASGPIFPTLIASTPARVGAANVQTAVGLQVAGAALGQAALPAALGLAIGAHGLEAIGPALCAAALLLAALYAGLARLSRAPARPRASAAPSRAPGAAARAGSPR